MDVVGHDRQCCDFDALLIANVADAALGFVFYRAGEDGTAVLGAPDGMEVIGTRGVASH